jgi:hypothetical protein
MPLAGFTASTAGVVVASRSPDLILRSYADGKLENESSITWTPDKLGFQLKNAQPAEPPALLLHPGTKEAVDEEEVERFGSARAAGRAPAIIAGLRGMHPIEDVEYLRTNAGENFYAKTNGHFFPLGLLGGGLNNVFRYLVSLDSVRGGFLGIDEVENGIHYSHLQSIFQTLVQASLETGTQLMMSTHSREAVQALATVAAEFMAPYQGRIGALHVRREGDVVTPTWFVGEEFISSVQLGYEMR